MKLPEAIKIVDSNKKGNKADIFIAASALNDLLSTTVVSNDNDLLNLCKICKIRCFRDYDFLKEKKLKMRILDQ